MSLSLGFNLANVFKVGGPTQQQVNQQAAITGGAAAVQTQDRMIKDKHRSESLRLVGHKVGERRVLDKAGITKVASAKKR